MKQPTKSELILKIKDMKEVGRLLSNVCFNLSYSTKEIDEYDRRTMDTLRKRWDEVDK